MSAARWLHHTSLAVTMAVLTGCGALSETPATQEPSSTTAGSPVGPNDVDANVPSAPAYPTDDVASKAAAETAASDTMTAFLRVDLDAVAWLDELSPHLSLAARTAYVGTDPLEVPARQTTGPARYDGSTSPYLAVVVVPTDVGDYRLLLVREGQGAPWLTETVTPPDGVDP